MTPLDRLRIEKAAADCGFEMTPVERGGIVELRSAHFSEAVVVSQVCPDVFVVMAPSPLLLDAAECAGTVIVTGFAALYDALRTAAAHARILPNRVAEAFRNQTAGLARSTEAPRLVIQRVGQNLFRTALLDYWQERCCVTGLAVPSLLRASHIKPWAKCETDDERLDVFNGLLLAPHIDALFDGGWISFADDGTVVTSETLSSEARSLLGVSEGWRVTNLKPEHLSYMSYHRHYQLRRRAMKGFVA